MSRDKPKEVITKISDIVCMVSAIVMAVVAVVIAIYILAPPKAYVQQWTSPAGTTYYISNMHMEVISSNGTK